MKYHKLLWIAVILMVAGVTSCKKDSNSSSDIIQDGSWKVTLYNDSGTDETSYFTGFSFTFSDNGSVSVVTASSTQSGNWTTGSDDSQDKLVLNFGAASPLEKLNNDWHIIEQSTNKVRMEDVSGGNGGTDLLTLEKL